MLRSAGRSFSRVGCIERRRCPSGWQGFSGLDHSGPAEGRDGRRLRWERLVDLEVS